MRSWPAISSYYNFGVLPGCLVQCVYLCVCARANVYEYVYTANTKLVLANAYKGAILFRNIRCFFFFSLSFGPCYSIPSRSIVFEHLIPIICRAIHTYTGIFFFPLEPFAFVSSVVSLLWCSAIRTLLVSTKVLNTFMSMSMSIVVVCLCECVRSVRNKLEDATQIKRTSEWVEGERTTPYKK